MQYYRTIEHTFEVDHGAELQVENRRGEILITAEERDDIAFIGQLIVNADSERDGEERLDAIELPIAATPSHVSIGPPSYDERTALSIFGISLQVPRSGTRVDMQLRVPRHVRVRSMSRSGVSRISGLGDTVFVGSRSGRVELRDIDGDVTVEGRSGGIEVRDVRGDIEVDNRSGKIEVEGVEGAVKVRTRSGATAVQQVTGAVDVQSRSGRLRLGDIGGEVEAHNRSGSVEYRGAIRSPMNIELASGSVRLALPRDAAFWMDAETRAGSIRSELPVDYLKEPDETAPTVRIRTLSGSIRVVAAALGLLALPGLLTVAQSFTTPPGVA
jgi:DUF4097 and DUF4098 domain-containing protein YvlB